MAILKNTTISGTGYLQPSKGTTETRPATFTSIIQWTNTGSQSYSVLAGPTPTISNTSWTAPTGVNSIEVLVVAGGGAGGGGAGGGAGGLIYNSYFSVVPGNSYTVTVGAGGSSSNNSQGGSGSNSVFGTLTAIGGGGGGTNNGSAGTAIGLSGGSGGGGCYLSGDISAAAGTGTAGQGNPGGVMITSTGFAGGGGGGAGSPGGNATGSAIGGGGGAGLNFSISGTSTWYAGGGAGSGEGPVLAKGGIGGGGNANNGASATAGTASTGGGGGGTNNVGSPGAGGSGIVIIRYTVQSDNTDTRGIIRYNTDIRGFEINDNIASGWVSQQPEYNFAGHNLFVYSQDFNNSWVTTGITLTSNNNLAPDGTSTATLMTASTGYVPFYRYDITAVAGETYTASGYFKAGTATVVYITVGNAFLTSAFGSSFNLSAGTTGITPWVAGGTNQTGSATFISSTITNVGNGWYRCSVTGIVDGSTTVHRIDYPLTTSASTYAWGCQYEKAISAGPYVKTVSAASLSPVLWNGYRIHTYTTTGTSGFTAACSGTVEVLVVAGGGGGGGGGGGAGGLIYTVNHPVISGVQYTVTVGGGGAGGNNATPGTNGSNSVFGTLTAIGGGGGGADNAAGRSGGSGGGGGATSSGTYYPGGYVVGQGNPGGINPGSTNPYPAAGGGGAGGKGGSPAANSSRSANGGIALNISISGTPTWYAGGGGGGNSSTSTGGGGGNPSGGGGVNSAGLANTGGGGGGTPSNTTSGAGGSGIVIVRYKYD